MAFIDTIDEPEIDAEVRAMYDRQQAHYGYVPNYARAFCHRPHVMALWAQLQIGIRREMDKRRFELVTFAAAHALRSTPCSIAQARCCAVHPGGRRARDRPRRGARVVIRGRGGVGHLCPYGRTGRHGRDGGRLAPQAARLQRRRDLRYRGNERRALRSGPSCSTHRASRPTRRSRNWSRDSGTRWRSVARSIRLEPVPTEPPGYSGVIAEAPARR